jgi:nucleoside-diphosphate-sugar epimerase
MVQVFLDFRPDAVMLFGKQRSAPYSMIDRQGSDNTQMDNVMGSINILYAIKEFAPDCHMMKQCVYSPRVYSQAMDPLNGAGFPGLPARRRCAFRRAALSPL